MTPEIEKKRRELFEAWYTDNGTLGKIPRSAAGRYFSDRANDSWHAFNAALDAVEIATPAISQKHSIEAQLVMRELCKDAITATGLGLRIK